MAQVPIDISAHFLPENRRAEISQTITFKNNSDNAIDTIYLQDWNNSYSANDTPLAVRFAEEFNNKFHFSKNEEKGFTKIKTLVTEAGTLKYERLPNQVDIIKVTLKKPLPVGQTTVLSLTYTLHFPSTKFNRYGINSKDELQLKDWFIVPAKFTNGEWNYYSNKDLDDQYHDYLDINITATHPKEYTIKSAYKETVTADTIVELSQKNTLQNQLYLIKETPFYEVETDKFTLLSNIDDEGIAKTSKSLVVDRIAYFLSEHLGDYPHEKIFITEEEYKRSPIYGLNQLPSFIRPFPDGFQYELKIFKTLASKYLDTSILTNKRNDYWAKDAIHVYLLMQYVDTFYPKLNLLGSFAKIWGIKSFHASELSFNDQYNFLYLNMIRLQLDQKLTTPKDELIKYNNNIGNKYKAGLGLAYLNDYLENDIISEAIKIYFQNNKQKTTTSSELLKTIKQLTNKDIDWFYEDYVDSRKDIDYKISKVTKADNTLYVTLKNKTNSKVPVALYSIKNDSIINKKWISSFKNDTIIIVPNLDQSSLVLNKEQLIVDSNQGNNFKKLKGLNILNKPFQLRLFQDIEDPEYSQVFFVPEFGYNVYDGFSPGIKLYNKTFLRKPLEYKLKPMYGLTSKSIIGSGTIKYTFFNKFSNNYAVQFGFSGSTYHYEENLSYKRFSPYINFLSRDQNNLRSNKKEVFNLRYVSVERERNQVVIDEDFEPDYGIVNLRYFRSNNELTRNLAWFADLQIAKKFSKVSFNLQYKKLFKNKRQINVRLFGGTFITNRTNNNSNYFDFALDRPTDYLFDYDYYGRSEDTGIFSQQIIIAEGCFKSKLQPAFANQWITTANASATIWKYIHAYGDIGFVKNKELNAAFVYDTGVRLNLVEDYFELYFPVYSNLGWEIAQPNYEEKIRFVVTLSPKTLISLFTRKWY